MLRLPTRVSGDRLVPSAGEPLASRYTHAALATRNTEFYGDRIFDPDAIASVRRSLEPIAAPWLQVHAVARERGLRLMTADRVGAEGIDPHHVLLVAYDWTPDAERLVAQGARAAALVSFEPPVIAWWLYYHLEQVSARFPHTFLFEGARDRVSPATRFHPLAFPLPCPPPQATGKPWSERRFLAMVNSNKAIPRGRDLARWLDRPREVSIKRELAGLRYRPIASDRYWSRLRAIEAFAARDDFDLYGEGWQTRHAAVDASLHAAAQRAYRGVVADKCTLLGGYRFAVAFENTRFPGYVSEKLFQCFYAGCIPVYSGAPDIALYVSPQAFIDARQFSSFVELERFLRGMGEADARRYLEAAQAFLTSAACARFFADRFAGDLVDALVQVAEL
jgi:alpha(1,3/1,4) fucosyltransferase